MGWGGYLGHSQWDRSPKREAKEELRQNSGYQKSLKHGESYNTPGKRREVIDVTGDHLRRRVESPVI